MEVCSGCGEQAPRHPIIGVGWDKKAERFAGYPVCAACWRDPEHRKVKLKMHFFDRSQEAQAVQMAGSSNLGSYYLKDGKPAPVDREYYAKLHKVGAPIKPRKPAPVPLKRRPARKAR